MVREIPKPHENVIDIPFLRDYFYKVF